jgi:hypothetical protein
MFSMVKGKDEDEEELIMRLRSSLIDGYISILHGMSPGMADGSNRLQMM